MTLLRGKAVLGLLDPGAVGITIPRNFGTYPTAQRNTLIFTHQRRSTSVIIYRLQTYKEQNNFS